ncbi:MAG: DMT family transporter [Bacillota bacterium]|nr:DMT family transporter [Bacillota bacterium]
MTERRTAWAYFLLIAAPAMWGGAFVAAKYLVLELHPTAAAAVRFIISFLFLLPFFLRIEGRRALPARRDLPVLLLLGASGVFAYNALFFYGMQWAAATDGSLVVASSPMLTVVLSVLFLRERFIWPQAAGLVLCLAGVTVIITKGSPDTLLGWQVNHGDILLLGCAASWAVYSVAGKVAMRRLSALASTTFSNGLGALMLIACAIPSLHWDSLVGLSARGWTSLLFLAVFASGIAFVFWLAGVRAIGAARSAVFVNLAPVSSALLGVLMLGERLAFFHLAGAVLVLMGVYLVSRQPQRPVSAAPAAAPADSAARS